MLKKTLNILSEKSKTKLIFYLFLSLIFVGLETSILVIVYPLIEVFLGSQTLDENKVFNFLNNYFLIKDLNGLISFAIILIFIRFVYFLFFNWLKYSYLNEIQKDVALKIFSQFHARTYFQIIKYSSATFIRDISSETTTFKKFCATYINLILEILISFLICCFLFVINPVIFFSLVLILLLFALIYFLIILKAIRLLGKKRIIINKNIIKVVNESYKFFELIKLNNKLKFFRKDLKAEFQKLINVNRYSQVINLIPRLFIETFLFLGFTVIFLFHLKDIGFKIDISVAGIFLVSFLRLFPSVSKIIEAIQNLNLYKYSIENIHNQIILNSMNTQLNIKSNKEFKFEKNIEIENLQFDYEGKSIFKEFNIKFKKNSFNAIMGQSGSGKSTFIKIFMGLLKSKHIDFKLDGKKTNIFKNFEWQSKIGYAGQNSLILNQNLVRNITLSVENDIDAEKFKNSFYNAGLDSFLDFDKNIYDDLNESGSNLSGGQLQRVCLSRALYFSEGILVLDEICSALDIESERKIILTLKKLSKMYTIIYITHRNNFKEYFDNLITI